MLLKRISGAFILALVCAQLALGVDYYVDNSCPNNGDGTAQTCAASPGAAGPFNSIANVQSAITGDQHGNSVLLAAGENFHEMYTIPANGTSGGAFTIGRYGSGVNPIVDGADVISSWTSASINTSGSITRTNAKFSLVNGSAFADFNGTGSVTLANYTGSLLTVCSVTNSTHCFSGYIKAAGTGEAYGSQLLPNTAFANTTGISTNSATVASVTSGCFSAHCLQMTLTAGYGASWQVLSLTSGMLVKSSIYLKTGTETGWMYHGVGDPSFAFITPANPYNLVPSVWTQYTFYGTADTSSASFKHEYEAATSGDTTFFDTPLAVQVTAPSSTGVTLTSTSGGSTFNLASNTFSVVEDFNDPSGYTFTISNASVAVYYNAPGFTPNQVFETGVRYTKVAALALLTPGTWFWDAPDSRVYVRTSGDNSPSNYTIEASNRNYAIYGFLKSYITLNGIQTTKAGVHGIYAFGTGVTGITVQNVSSTYNYDDGIFIGQATNSQIVHSTFSYNGGNGTEDYDAPGLYVGYVVAHHNGQLTNNLPSAGIKYSPGTASGTVEYSVSCLNGLIPGTGGVGGGMWFDTTDASIARYNLVYGNSSDGIAFEAATNDKVYGNVVYNNGFGASGSWPGIGISSGASGTMTGTWVYGNTSYGNNIGMMFTGPGSAGGCLNNLAENNIVANSTTTAFSATNGCENPGTNGSGNIYTYNDFGTAASNFIEWGAGVNYSTYATWEAAAGNCGTTGCSHSVQTDPTFANAAGGQFWQTVGSSGIASGMALGAPYNIGIQPGASWPYNVFTVTNTNNDLGAFVYTGSVIDSVIGSGTQASGTTK